MTAFTLDNPAGVPSSQHKAFSNVAVIPLGDRTLLMLAGQVAWDDDHKIVGGGDLRAQTRRVMDLIVQLLAAHGATLADVVSLRTFLTDISRIREYGDVRGEYFQGLPAPTSTTVEVASLFLPEALIEVEATAVI
ncbi:2-iminobutanoate/2-iminopropanoate deaminase [Catenulispora sp. EB89]|uniref:RidA family protein n=1 Tax=Catenulispora sp. EB89 TaxID=3156257 RepID=UPI0035124E8D